MSPEEYIDQRLDNQIAWYSGKSRWNQRCFRGLRAIEILFAVTIPFVLNLNADTSELLKASAGLMGITIALIAGMITLYRFQEHWIEYRTTAETLKHEKYLYLTQSAPYDGEGAFSLLVNRIEALISKQNTAWAKTTRDAPSIKNAA